MLRTGGEGRRERAKSLAAVIAIHLALGYALLAGLTPRIVETVEASLKLFEVSEVPPPPPIVEVPPPPKESKSAPEGEPSPPNIRSVATPVVAPPPEVKIEVPPPPIAAAPLPAEGSDRTSGAAPVAGPGTGAGGVGSGTGSGGRGAGTGAGGTGNGAGPGGVAVGARLVRGRLRNSDYPRSAARAKAGGTVMVSYEVGADGRVRDCRIMKSSGNDDLDGITCYLIQERFRYAPARDFEGRPVSDKAGWRQDWWLER